MINKTLSLINLHVLGSTKQKSHLKRLIRRMLRKPHERDFELLKYINDEKNDLYLDIGANYGQSIDSISLYKPNSNIISFEPNKNLVDWLKGLYSGKEKIEIKNFGLGSNPSSCDLFVPTYLGHAFEGLASVKEDQAKDIYFKDKIHGFQSELVTLEKIHCEIKTLDTLDLKPFFIKIDVERGELDVIRGGIETIQNHTPILLIENVAKGDEIASLLTDLDYIPYRYDSNKLYAEEFGHPNTFFIPSNKLHRILCSVSQSQHVLYKKRIDADRAFS